MPRKSCKPKSAPVASKPYVPFVYSWFTDFDPADKKDIADFKKYD